LTSTTPDGLAADGDRRETAPGTQRSFDKGILELISSLGSGLITGNEAKLVPEFENKPKWPS
jgi:hypothetical protein